VPRYEQWSRGSSRSVTSQSSTSYIVRRSPWPSVRDGYRHRRRLPVAQPGSSTGPKYRFSPYTAPNERSSVISSDTTTPPISLRLPSPPSMMPPVGKASRYDSRSHGNEILVCSAERADREGLANRWVSGGVSVAFMRPPDWKTRKPMRILAHDAS